MRPSAAALSFLALLAASAAQGQFRTVYVADSDSARVWGFAGIAPVDLGRPDPPAAIEDMAVMADGQLLLAGRQLGIARLDPLTQAAAWIDSTVSAVEIHADCLSQDIYFVDDDSTTLYVLPDGGPPAVNCMSFPRRVLDLLVAPAGPRRGHLIVLLAADGDTAPPYIADYERTGETSFTELDPVVDAATDAATDIAFRPPDGALFLLDTINGLYRVGPDGGLIHFAPPHVGGGADDMDIGSDRVIYIASGAQCGVIRVTQAGQIVNPTLQTTYGCPTALAAIGFTPTPLGTGVRVNPAEVVQLQVEEVVDGGFSTASLTRSSSRTSPRGNTLPPYAALPSGETQFTYIGLSSTASHENLIQADALLPGTRLFACASNDSARGTFHDVTIEGSIEDARGVIPRFDELVLVVDNRPAEGAADSKFGRLFEVLVPGETDPPELLAAKAELDVYADQAFAYYESYLYEWAISELSAMNAVVRAYAGGVIPNSPADPEGNVAGEMLSRSKTLMFTLGLLTPPTGVPESGAGTALSLSCSSPARGECALAVAGPAAERVTVTVCTAGGRVVRTLHDGPFAGATTLVWDGTDDHGRRVASGVYFARAECRGEVAESKVVFVR
jgi:hypothetical protein